MLRFPAVSTLRGSALLLLALTGCVESYMPDVASAPSSLLVVDGFINGNGATRLKLTRSVSLSGSAVPAEKGARVAIQDNTGVRYPLTEKTAGYYVSDSLVLPAGRQYQLRFTTSTGVAYASDAVPLKVTPPIDKLSWQLNGPQVQLALSTHDATGQSRYYRWGFTETWQFDSAFESVLEYDPVQKIVVGRTVPIRTCWRTEKPSGIRQATTAQLGQDVLTNAPLLDLDGHDERFKVRYSVLVSEYAETAAEFNYYELLRKNTEAVGGVNDPLPVQLTGNVHRLDNASEPVLGYVGAHTVQYQRLFIDRQDLPLPAGWSFNTPYDFCTQTIELVPDPKSKPTIHIPETRVFSASSNTPIDYYYDNGVRAGYIGSSTACVDCRTRGTNVKPSYW